jgi:hypothetical protein
MPADLVDPAPGSPLRRTRPGRYQTIEAKAHGENDPATAKPRLSDRAAESTTTQPSTGEVIFDPVIMVALSEHRFLYFIREVRHYHFLS